MEQTDKTFQITGLSSQLRDSNRVNVSINGKFDFSLDVSQVVDLGIKKGQIITEEELQDLRQESEFGKLYARTLEYTLMRPHSSREIRDYLYRKTLAKKYRNRKTGSICEKPGVSKSVTERVFEKLSERGYVDDEKFAQWWVDNRNQTKGTSIKKLRNELSVKGISRNIVEKILSETERNDTDELKKMIEKKRRRYPDEKKLIQYLARQGFLYDDIKNALRGED